MEANLTSLGFFLKEKLTMNVFIKNFVSNNSSPDEIIFFTDKCVYAAWYITYKEVWPIVNPNLIL